MSDDKAKKMKRKNKERDLHLECLYLFSYTLSELVGEQM
jgi:hypothetical protein